MSPILAMLVRTGSTAGLAGLRPVSADTDKKIEIQWQEQKTFLKLKDVAKHQTTTGRYIFFFWVRSDALLLICSCMTDR